MDQLDRRELLLSLFDSDGFGLEIGPSYDPFLPKSQGYNVETVDHADAETLRKKYSDNASKIETVDHVSDGGSLLDLIGQRSRYDFIYASHMIEHVTDIVRFIQDCEALLKPEGVLVLVVPDKRFHFDALRPVSTVGDALQAYHEARKRHSPGQVFDFMSLFCLRGGTTIWSEPTLDDMVLSNDLSAAHGQFNRAQNSLEYIDIHAWRFTPSYFRYLIKTLRTLNYIQSGVAELITNDDDPVFRFEFYATLSKTAPRCEDSDIDLLKAAEEELRVIRGSRGSNSAL